MTDEQSADLSDYLENDPGHWEASIFLYFGGLLRSSTAYANRLGYGFDGKPPSITYTLPQQLEALLGLKVDPQNPPRLHNDALLLKLTPMSEKEILAASGSYLLWHRLFPENAPGLVLQFSVIDADEEDDRDEHWLVWDWWCPPRDRLSVLKTAYDRLSILMDDEEWLPLLQRAALESLHLFAEGFIERGGVPPHILERLRAT